MALSPELLALIVCPDDKGELWYLSEEGFLYNPRMKRKYRIDGNIPVLLIEESEIVDAQEHERISSLAHIATGKG